VATFTALFDACVLYPAPLRDLLMRLALTDLFRAKWTDQIHEEWIGNVLADRPDLTRLKLEGTRDLMNTNVRDCLVTDYEDLIEAIPLTDLDDRHVLAAAIRSHANVIVTFNLRDFPEDLLQRYGIEAQHPDDFITHLLDLDPAAVYRAVKRQREALKAPPRTAEELLETFEKQGLVQTVAHLRTAIDLL
jgi:hypothetical protein